MFRILIFLIVVFCLGLGFAWLADRPGEMVITFNGYQYQVTLMVAAAAAVTVIAAVMITWWILKSIWNSPRAVGRYFRARRRDRGYQALSTGLIAAGSGDSGLARKMGKQAQGLMSADQEPLIHLLEAQTMLLEGRHDNAREKFEQMANDPETRLLGLRGLYLEAQRLGEGEAARHYAEQAAEAAPQLTWASNAAIETQTISGNWDAAMKLVATQASTKQISKEEAAQRRAVLLTAKSMASLDIDTTAARSAALEASKLAPEFVPAVLAAGQALLRNDEIRKATRLLENSWKKSPHPEVADLYIHARAGDSTHDRLKRARRLESLKKNHVESALAVARAANDAGEYLAARQAIEAALKLQPRESAYLLLADIEENETGDQGRVRHWLSKAVRAERDPAWTADGYVSEQWAPASPITGALGAFEWKVPVERLGTVIEAVEEEFEPDIPVISVMADSTEDDEMPVIEEEPPQQEAADGEPPADSETPADTQIDAKNDSNQEADNTKEQPAAIAEAGPVAADSEAPVEEKSIDTAGKEKPVKAEAETEPDTSAEDDKVPPHPIPDDPGVEEGEAGKETPGRFRLF